MILRNEVDHGFSYSKALLGCDPTKEQTLAIRLNRALAFLKIQQFDAALRDIAMGPSDLKSSEKGLFRKAQALYNLQKFGEACDVYSELRKEYPANTAAKNEFIRAITRLAEQECGQYQFKRLQSEAKTSRPPRLDHATYIGPVSVEPSETRGRGLFTKKAVKAGDLLFCEKAFAYVFLDGEDARQAHAISVNLGASMMAIIQSELIQLVVQKLYKNPSLTSTFTDLFHASFKSVDVREVDGSPIVDMYVPLLHADLHLTNML